MYLYRDKKFRLPKSERYRGYAAECRCLVHVLKGSTKLPHEYNYKISEEI